MQLLRMYTKLAKKNICFLGLSNEEFDTPWTLSWSVVNDKSFVSLIRFAHLV